MPDIFPITWRKGNAFYHAYTRQGIKIFTINSSLDKQEEIIKMIVEAANDARTCK